MPHIAEAGRPAMAAQEDEFLKTYELPRLPEIGQDQQEKYIVAVKPDAPFDYRVFCGITWQKRVRAEEASMVKNQDKFFDWGWATCWLSERQVQYIKARASKTCELIPQRFNWDKGNDPTLPKYHESQKIVLADWLVLEKLSTFNPVMNVSNMNSTKVEEPQRDESAEFDKALIEAQTKPRKNK